MGRQFTKAALAVALVVAGKPAFAAQVVQTLTISASPDAVWSVVGGFPDIVTWLPGVVSSPADKGSAPGSTRVITLKAPGGPTITEQLTARDEAKHRYTYRIVKVDPKTLPVVDYTSTISIAAHGKGSLITWRGNFSPAAGSTDTTAKAAVTGIYRAGLAHVKSLSETHS